MKAELIVKDHGLDKFFERVRQIREAHVKVGVLADTEKGGLHVDGAALSVAEIAAVNIFGTQDGRIPARDFLRPTFDEQRETLAEMGRKLMGAVIDGDMKVERALNLMGAFLATAMKKKITTGAGVPPPDAPSTVMRKLKRGRFAGILRRSADTLGRGLAQVAALASVRTLVDSGRLVGAISWAVVMGAGEREER